jgi:hypothetical protein
MSVVLSSVVQNSNAIDKKASSSFSSVGVGHCHRVLAERWCWSNPLERVGQWEFLQRAQKDPMLRRAHRIHALSSVIGATCFFVEVCMSADIFLPT